jgi:3-isopropylmalate/(R)-2-methylmalate dehydratase large subunit
VAERMTICNMAVEMGAKAAYMKSNDKVVEYLKERTDKKFEIQETDADFEYSESHVFDISGYLHRLQYLTALTMSIL